MKQQGAILVPGFFVLMVMTMGLWGPGARASYTELPRGGCPGHEMFWRDHFCHVGRTTGPRARLDCMADASGRDFEASRLMRGGAPNLRAISGLTGVDCLARQGVTLIIDLRGPGEDPYHRERQQADRNHVSYANEPMNTGRTAAQALQNQRSVVRALLRIKQHLAENPQNKIFVHCAHGEDRTGLVIGAYRSLLERAPLTEARRDMQRHMYGPYPALEAVWRDLNAVASEVLAHP